MATAEEIVKKYKTCRGRYVAFAKKMRKLIEEILEAESLRVHSVDARAKEIGSLSEKVRRPGKNYQRLEQVTDLCGARVISYFADDVDRIRTTLENEFDIDNELSVDKRREIPDSEFGYRSLHLVGQLSSERARLSEYGTYKDFFFEIQIRSILQHTWAEINHDLGYKNPTGIPRALRRRFARLAALLEIADDEFEQVRDDIGNYSEEVATSLKEEPGETEIDQISLQQFLASDPTIDRFAKILSKRGEAPVGATNPSWVGDLPEQLKALGITSIQDLQFQLSDFERKVLSAWNVVFIGPLENWTKDMILFAFVLVKIAVENSQEEAEKLFKSIRVIPGDDFQQEVLMSLDDAG